MSRSHRVDYLPTPRQIVAECAAIRLLWTPAERRRRRVGFRQFADESRWMPPHIAVGACVARVRKVVAEATA